MVKRAHYIRNSTESISRWQSRRSAEGALAPSFRREYCVPRGRLYVLHVAHGDGQTLGVSEDSSCADHNIAWRTRFALGLDHAPGAVSGDSHRPDNIVYDITPQDGQMPGLSACGWGHPTCSGAATSIAENLPQAN